MKYLLVLYCCTILTAVKAQPAALDTHRLRYKTALVNEINADTAAVEFYPYNQKFIIIARLELLKDQPVFPMTTSSGIKKEAQQYARLTFRFNGRSCTLVAYQLIKLKNTPGYENHFFIPFKDLTTGKATYEGGRYLDFSHAEIQNGTLVIDFNKAYNPYCAFTEGYNCPIPPRENSLQIRVTAGEKKYRGRRE